MYLSYCNTADSRCTEQAINLNLYYKTVKELDFQEASEWELKVLK